MLRDIDGDTTDVNTHIVNDTCHCDVSLSGVGEEPDEPKLVHTSQQLESACACSIFHRHGCVPHIEDLTDNSFVVATYLPSRDALRQMIEELRTITDPVRLVRIADTSDSDEGRTHQNVLFDLTILTKKQRTTLETAVISGYYDKPKKIDMEDLADDLGISKATLSYRLKTAEAKIVNNLIDSNENDADRPGE